MSTMHVAAVCRYPVKSMGGEDVDRLELTSVGPVGDRNWAVIDTARRSIRSAKQWPEILRLRAHYLTPPVADAYDEAVSGVVLTSPDGSARQSGDRDLDEWLADQLGRPSRLAARRPAWDRDHYLMPRARTNDEIAAELDLLAGEVLPDFDASADELIRILQTSATPPGSYVDAYPIHLVTQRSLDTFSARSGCAAPVPRFRPNIVIDVGDAFVGDDQPELGWIGATVRVGGATLAIRSPTMRCSMPARAQPLLGLEADSTMTRALVHHASRLLGVNATVVSAGTVQTGDPVTVERP